jgi:aminopeptidase YwaD
MLNSLDQELKSYINQLTSVKPDRFIGSRGHGSAFKMIKGLLSSWGLSVFVQSFTVDITVPVKWSLELDIGKGFEKVDSLPGLGSPTVKGLVSELLPVGHAREEDYYSLDRTNGRAHVASLWKNHETVKVSEAAIRGASALIWYNDYFDELYSGACDYNLSPIPGISIRKSVAERILEKGGGNVRFSVLSKHRRIRCYNLEATRGQAHGDYILLTAHYDSRPHTPGASDDASGIAVMLAFIKNNFDAESAFPVRYFFADCEEVGCRGAETYAEHIYRTNRLKEIQAVVNLDAVGWPNLCLIARDREAVMDEELTELAEGVLREMGSEVEKVRSKSGKSNHTPFAARGVRTLWYSDYPNYIRHSTVDNAFNIDYPTMTLVAESLRTLFNRMG